MHHTSGLSLTGFQPNPNHGFISNGYSHEDRQVHAHHRDNEFVTLMNAFRHSGGLARAPEVAARIANRGSVAASPLAGWLVNRQVICVDWHETLWLPLFQFDATGLSLKAGLAAVLAELVRNRDDWAVASWFAQANPWLANCTPADSLAAMAQSVLTAARWERKLGVA